MAQETVEKRVSALEKTVQNQVTSRDLEASQTALSAQILQLGAEMRVEFSALREEIRGGDEETRQVLREEIRAGDEETRRVLRDEIRAGDEETRQVLRDEIRAGDEETRQVLRDEIRAGDEETRRVLRDEIRGGDEQTRGLVEERTAELLAVIAAGNEEIRRHARMLHDEVIERIKAISTG